MCINMYTCMYIYIHIMHSIYRHNMIDYDCILYIYIHIFVYTFAIYIYARLYARLCSEGLDMYVQHIHMYTYIHYVYYLSVYICTYMYITLYNANMFAPAILLMCLPTTLRLQKSMSLTSRVCFY